MCRKSFVLCNPRCTTNRRLTRPRFSGKEIRRRLGDYAMANIDDLKKVGFWRGVLAEFTACVFLVLVGCGASIDTTGYPVTFQVAFAFGFMYAVLIYCLRHVSGGHINPAVSLAMAATCKISLARAIIYVIAQTIGATLGAAILYGVTPEQHRGILGCTQPRQFVTEGQAFGVEFFATLILVFITFACFEEHTQTEERRCPGHLVIGLAVAALLFFAAPLSGGSFNPARSFGPAVVRGIWKYHWVFWFGTIFGGVLGGVLYEIVFSKTATVKQLVSCMAGIRKPPGKEGEGTPAAVLPPPSPAPDNEVAEAERQALRPDPAGPDKASDVQEKEKKEKKKSKKGKKDKPKPENREKLEKWTWPRYSDTSFNLYRTSAL